MQTLQIDQDNNLVITRDNLTVTDGINACAQDTKTRIGLIRGENPYDTSDGIAFYTDILGKMGGVDFVRSEIRNRIMMSDEITGITRLAVEENRETQTTNVAADITTIYGGITL